MGDLCKVELKQTLSAMYHTDLLNGEQCVSLPSSAERIPEASRKVRTPSPDVPGAFEDSNANPKNLWSQPRLMRSPRLDIGYSSIYPAEEEMQKALDEESRLLGLHTPSAVKNFRSEYHVAVSCMIDDLASVSWFTWHKTMYIELCSERCEIWLMGLPHMVFVTNGIRTSVDEVEFRIPGYKLVSARQKKGDEIYRLVYTKDFQFRTWL
jgi:hypothetical protein